MPTFPSKFSWTAWLRSATTEPAAGAEDGWLLHEEWVVVHSPLVFVREEPEDESRKLGYKWRGERVAVSGERGPWLKLALEEDIADIGDISSLST